MSVFLQQAQIWMMKMPRTTKTQTVVKQMDQAQQKPDAEEPHLPVSNFWSSKESFTRKSIFP